MNVFGLHFIKTGIVENRIGKFFSDIYDMRQTGDYDDYIDFSKADVIDLVEPSNELISKAEELLSIDKCYPALVRIISSQYTVIERTPNKKIRTFFFWKVRISNHIVKFGLEYHLVHSKILNICILHIISTTSIFSTAIFDVNIS